MSLDAKRSVELSVLDTNGEFKDNANDFISDGKLYGYLSIINGKGSFAGTTENNAKGIYYYNERNKHHGPNLCRRV